MESQKYIKGMKLRCKLTMSTAIVLKIVLFFAALISIIGWGDRLVYRYSCASNRTQDEIDFPLLNGTIFFVPEYELLYNATQ
jgi:hypothetical protein